MRAVVRVRSSTRNTYATALRVICPEPRLGSEEEDQKLVHHGKGRQPTQQLHQFVRLTLLFADGEHAELRRAFLLPAV